VPLRFRSVPVPGASFCDSSSLVRTRTSRLRGAPRRAGRAGALALGVALTALLLPPTRVFADATVVVELKRPDGSSAEGTVQLTKGDTKYRCSTDKAGRCELRGVTGGIYTVSVEQSGRAAPKDKSVVIPPSGEVKLIVNAS